MIKHQILIVFTLLLLLFVVKTQTIPTIELGYLETITVTNSILTYQLIIPEGTKYFKIKTVPEDFKTPIDFYFGPVSIICNN